MTPRFEQRLPTPDYSNTIYVQQITKVGQEAVENALTGEPVAEPAESVSDAPLDQPPVTE